jgi:excisionase family DNA binding protein
MRASAQVSHAAPDEGPDAARPMLTREETAAYLAVSTRTLDRLVRAGEFPAYRIGGHRRFRKTDIDQYVASKME